MQIIRTIVWVVILFAILTFSFFNWETVEVNLWENLVLETKVPVLVIIAFLLGLVPMWLYHRSVKWSLSRRIRSLENSIKTSALAPRSQPADEVPVESSGDDAADSGDILNPGEPESGDKPA